MIKLIKKFNYEYSTFYSQYYLFIYLYFFLYFIFFQSALDKILNKKDNLDWLNSHFKSSILSNSVPFYYFLV